MRWMEIAWADVGVHEVAGPEANPKILAYFKDAGRADVTSDETAWCAAYVAACLARASMDNPIPKAERLLAVSYRTIGTHIDEPRVGAVAVVRRPGGYHTGFVTGWTDTHLKLLGGNQADQVSEKAWPREDLVELRWPTAPATASQVEKLGSKTVSLAARQGKDAAKATTVGGSGPVIPFKPALPEIKDLPADLTAAQQAFDQVQAFATFLQIRWPYVAAGIAAYYGARMAWTAWLIAQARTADHNTGANTGRGTAAPPETQEAAA